jgi:hypothetical protein
MISETFKSRYGVMRTVHKIDDRTWILEGESLYVRGSDDGKGWQMADFEGGPYLETGLPLSLVVELPDANNKIIKKLEWLPKLESKPDLVRLQILTD